MHARRVMVSAALILAINLIGLMTALGPDDVSEDKDTQAIVSAIAKRNAPLSWFATDWPLENGFYRPVPTLTFAFDRAVYGGDLPKYRLTNWLIACLCSFALVWFVWELFSVYAQAVIAGALFAFWQSGAQTFIRLDWVCWLGAGIAFIWCLASPKGRRLDRLLLAGTLMVLAFELVFGLEQSDINSRSLAWRVVGWPPGRTASCMALFALTAMAAYCRFERTQRGRWLALSGAGLASAFLSYEQSVVLIGCFAGIAIVLRIQHVRVHWIAPVCAAIIGALYAGLHSALLRSDTAYRLQQARPIVGGVRDLTAWLVPFASNIRSFVSMLIPDIGIVFLSGFWMRAALAFGSLVGTAAIVRRPTLLCITGLLGSAGTYGPLAFQHPFAHYFYLPAAFRAMFATGLILIAVQSATGSERRAE